MAFILSYGQVAAQNLSNLRYKKLYLTSADTVYQFDTLSVVPQSFLASFHEKPLSPDDYLLNEKSATIRINNPFYIGDTLTFTYRVFPFYWEKKHYHKPLSENQSYAFQPFTEIQPLAPADTLSLFNQKGIIANGSISRGITTGNLQDLAVQSNLELQLLGNIGQGIEVAALISDTNIPFQTDGTTQQLQEFDRVFIKVSKDAHSLVAGDYVLSDNGSYFLKYQKKIQGLGYQFKQHYANNDTILAQANFAVSRGKYARNTFVGQESVQGPYKLNGNNYENFIVILSGSERVYIDGELLQRGALEDYTIDYNLAEVTFTGNQLITKDKRIVVEFEYIERSYQRYLWQANVAFSNAKWQLKTQFLQESDAKFQQLNAQLSEADILRLENAGDSLQLTATDAATPAAYELGGVFYVQKDTLYQNNTYQIYQYSQNTEIQLYQVRFSPVGEGNGYYRIASIPANGIVYEWSPPDSLGNLTGNYEAVQYLQAPIRQTYAQIQTAFQYHKNAFIQAEAYLSQYDANTFSQKDDQDNQGTALKLNWEHTFLPFGEKKISLKPFAQYMQVGKNVRTIIPFVPIEFYRNWNVNEQILPQNEAWQWWQSGFETKNAQHYTWKILYQGLQQKQNDFLAHKYAIEGKQYAKNFTFETKINQLFTEGIAQKTTYFFPQMRLDYQAKSVAKYQAGVAAQMERNNWRNTAAANDSLLVANSFYYQQWSAYVGQNTQKFPWKMTYLQRYDFEAMQNNWQKSQYAQQLSLNASLNSEKQQFQLKIDARRLTFLLRDSIAQNTLLGEMAYQRNFFQQFLNLNARYALGAGQQQKLEEIYFQVPAGQGTHILLPTGEYILANATVADTANYRQQWLPTGVFEAVRQLKWSHLVQLDFKKIASDASFWKKWFAESEMDRSVNRKYDQNFAQNFNPFGKKNDALGEQLQIQHHLLFTASSRLKTQLYYRQTRRQNTLLSGYDIYTNKVWEWNNNFGINTFYVGKIILEKGQKINESTVYLDRNFEIDYINAQTFLQYTPNTKFRWEVGVFGNKQQNHSALSEKMIAWGIWTESKFIRRNDFTLQGRLKMSHIAFTDINRETPNTQNAVAYTMLEALHPGTNWQWHIDINKRLPKNLGLSVGYSGQAAHAVRVRHTGNLELKAFF
ncbi:MAG: hypothetical protein R2798_11000 [Chitinophagales bacterium]|nr:hypothetical protein [Bacteroidota bacterium]MCB9043267.1 hypothetical protein [Chitinophagales bacterium]